MGRDDCTTTMLDEDDGLIFCELPKVAPWAQSSLLPQLWFSNIVFVLPRICIFSINMEF